ncbi:FAD-dependent oxidoreductase, partial [candidate division WOR-3 bacterium]|nr:FAD-dependent oxidoreductase [candidate division WOR-3 bacterium]
MSEKVNITINGKNMQAEKGKTVLEICRENDIYIPALCEEEILEPYGSCRMCLVEIERDGKKRVETSCTTYVQDGMEIKTDTEEVIESRKINLELLLSEHYGDCIGPCKKACPLHYDVPTYVALIADGKPREALQVIKGSTPVAYSLGAVCPAFCEDECRRQKVEESIAIRLLKKAVAEFDMKSDNPYVPEVAEERSERIAIVGGGPAGLTAAYQLRKKGYRITIYEAQDKLGGMLRYGIPEFRLPKAILDREIELALSIGGIDVKYSTKLGKDISLEELSKNYDAVFIATGAWKDRVMGIEGENLEGVYTGIVFLHSIATNKEVNLGKKVTVIGGGNTAMDVARTAKRLGSDVTILYRRSRNEMPADEIELKETEEEGIEFRTLTNITAILGNGRAEGIRCIKMELGEPDESGRRRPVPIQGSEYEMETDSVVMAIGQYGDIEEIKEYGIDCGKTWINAGEYFQNTNKPNIFAGGDIVLGPATVVESCAQADRATHAIDLYLNNKLETIRKVIQEPWNWIQEIES